MRYSARVLLSICLTVLLPASFHDGARVPHGAGGLGGKVLAHSSNEILVHDFVTTRRRIPSAVGRVPTILQHDWFYSRISQVLQFSSFSSHWQYLDPSLSNVRRPPHPWNTYYQFWSESRSDPGRCIPPRKGFPQGCLRENSAWLFLKKKSWAMISAHHMFSTFREC